MVEQRITPIAVVDEYPIFRLGIFAALMKSAYEVVSLSGLVTEQSF